MSILTSQVAGNIYSVTWYFSDPVPIFTVINNKNRTLSGIKNGVNETKKCTMR